MRVTGRIGSAIGTSAVFRLLVASALAASFCAHAQVITTFAGTDFTYPSAPLPAMKAPLGNVHGVVVDAQGNVYLSDQSNNLVLRRSLDGTLTVVAGNGIAGFSGDGGRATSASLNGPFGIALDSSGNLYIADNQNGRVRRVSDGMISTVAGNGAIGSSGDGGPATAASLNGPSAVALDAAGHLYIADFQSNRVREVSNGIITTIAGNGEPGYSGDGGAATSAQLHGPSAIAVDSAGNLYIADQGNGCIRKLTAGIITTVVSPLNTPEGVIVDSKGDLYISDSFDHRILRVVKEVQTVVAGGNGEGFAGDGGLATKAQLAFPSAIARDSNGNLYIADSANYRVRFVDAQGIINTIAGDGNYQFAGDGGESISAALNQPASVAFDHDGNVYVADALNKRVRKIAGGNITTIAGPGTGTPLYSNPSCGPSCQANGAVAGSYPLGLAVDAIGNLYISLSNCCIQVIRPSGNGYVIPLGGFPQPQGLTVDASGNLYFADSGNSIVGLITPAGVIKTIAGTGSFGFSGDGGRATEATLAEPTSVAVDQSGNIYIADRFNQRIRKVSNGIITTFAGGGQSSADGGSATGAELVFPTGVAVDDSGDVYIADGVTSRILKVSGGMIATIAGANGPGYSGDGGPATNAQFNFGLICLPQFAEGSYCFGSLTGIAIDSSGNLLIPDSSNNRIRKELANPPGVTAAPQQLQFTAQSQGAPTMPQSLSLTSPVESLQFSISVPDNIKWLQVNPSSGATPRLFQVVADPTNLGASSTPYKTSITISIPYGNPNSISVPVSFTVAPEQPPKLSVDKTNLSFPFVRKGGARSQTIVVSNSGGQTLSFSAVATTLPAGGKWLSVLPASGQALPASPATLTTKADPTGLSPGTYTGVVSVSAGTQSQKIPVTMTISTLDQAILLSQTGLSFLGVSQGGVLPSQTFGVLNIGNGVMNWKLSTSTLPPGGTWLHAKSNSSGTDAASETVPTVQVSVDAASLPQGTYYGLVRVDAPGAANTPQVVTVVVQVLAPGSSTGAVIQPAELLFTATAGGESPGSQNLFVYNVAAAPKTFQASGDKVLNLAILPANATLDPQEATRVVVQPFTSGLTAGVYTGVITFQFSDGNVLSANVRVIVAASGASSGSTNLEQGHDARKFDTSAPCTPTKLVLASNTLAQSFKVPAGYPVGLEVNVKDDCGTALSSGSVTASFSNSDPELQLHSLKNGLWSATWQTNNSSESAVTVTLQANDVHQKLQGKSVVNTSLTATTDQPVFPLQGVVSAAGGQSFVPVAPGSIISIYGEHLAGNEMSATSVPLPSELVDASVFMAGRLLPLYYVSDKQVNAQVPFDIDPNATYQILVLRGPTYSLPVGVDVASAQPAVFTDSSVAPNQGFIYVVRGKEQFEAKPTSPASEGDVIVMFCSGLGAVNPAIAAGAPANGQPTALTPTVTIGGLNAAVNFSGLTPGFVGLYQINAVVPKGVASGNAVPVTINIAGQTSPHVVMAIQ